MYKRQGVQTDSFDWLIGSDRWKKRVEEDEANGTNTCLLYTSAPRGELSAFKEVPICGNPGYERWNINTHTRGFSIAVPL